MDSRKKPNLRAGLAELDRLADKVALPADSYSQLVGRLEKRRNRRTALRVTTLSLAVASLVLLALLARRPGTIGRFEIAARSEDFSWRLQENTVHVTSGSARFALRSSRAQIGVRSGSRLRAEEAGVRVLGGSADFDVEPHGSAIALKVLVSHGTIEVTGTRFLVEQGDLGGTVVLHRGQIRFVASSGENRLLVPGDRLAWPLLPSPAPSTARPATEAAPSAATLDGTRAPRDARAKPAARPALAQEAQSPPAEPVAEAMRKYLTEIDALRIRHDYAGLAARLEAVLRTSVREPMRESLSYELADVLLHKTADHDRACVQVAGHLRRYPAGAYSQRLKNAATAMHCPE
jgi:hypothetical protein